MNNNKISQRHLWALALGGFGIGLTEFVIMGLLPDVASYFKVSIPEAGYLISSYALGVVIGAPILTIFSSKTTPKRFLIFLGILFTLFNGLSALVHDFSLLVVIRFFAGLPHGAFFGIGAVVANRLAPKGKGSSAVAMMLAGLTVSNVIGVPIGTWLGSRYGWYWAFVLVAVIGLITIIAIKMLVPDIKEEKTRNPLEELKVFKNVNLWLGIAITSIGFGGFFAWISYISPLLTEVSGFSKESIPFWMTLVGIGMTVGILIGGKLSDKFSPVKASFFCIILMMVMLLLNALLSPISWTMYLLVFFTGVVAMTQCPPMQMLLIENSKEAETLGSSLGQSSFNVGNSLGAYLGGIPLLMGYSFVSTLWVGVVMCFVGAIINFVLMRRYSRGI